MSRGRIALAALLASGCGRIAFDDVGDVSDASTPIDEPPAVGDARVQRMSVGITSPMFDVSIAPVDPARTFVLCDHRTDTSAPAAAPTCELVSPTQVRLTSYLVNPATVVAIQVIELAAGARVQRGLAAFAATEVTHSVPLTAVDPARSFVITSRRTSYQFNDDDPAVNIQSRLFGPSELVLDRFSQSTAAVEVAWQVVETPAAVVHHDEDSFSTGAIVDQTPVPTVDLAASFILGSHQASSDDEAEYLVRFELPDNATVSATRNRMTTALQFYAAQVVTVAGARVQSGTTMMADQPFVSTPLQTIDLGRTFVVTSVSGGMASFDNHLDAALVTSLLFPSSLRFDRGQSTDANTRVSWFVVEWPP